MLAVEISHEFPTPILPDILALLVDWSMLGMYVVAYFMIENSALHGVAYDWSPSEPGNT
jgi:hypothetical protein